LTQPAQISLARFLINLRDATAHGDARNISPAISLASDHSALDGLAIKQGAPLVRRFLFGRAVPP
jgi:hypothetical protein